MIGLQNVRRYAEAVRRVFGSEEVVPPGFLLEVDRPEWGIHKGDYKFTTGLMTVAGVANNVGRCQVLNPAGSGRLVVITHFMTLTGALSTVWATIDAAAAGAPAPNLAVDTRIPINAGAGAPTVVSDNLIANNNPTISGYNYFRFSSPANQWGALQTLPVAVILAPTHNFTLFDTLVADPFSAFIYGYEREARPEELFQ